MTGKVKKIIDHIVAARSAGCLLVEKTTKTKLIIKGFDPGKFHDETEDDLKLTEEITKIAKEFGVELPMELL